MVTAVLVALCGSIQSIAQTDSAARANLLPYQQYPKLPAFNIMLEDSSLFNTFNIEPGPPIVLMLFSPDCKHCNDEMRLLTKGMDSLKDIRFYLVSSEMAFDQVHKFRVDHQLDKYVNIKTIGIDYRYFFVSYYGVREVPALVLYDGNKKLVRLWESTCTVKQLYEAAFIQEKQ